MRPNACTRIVLGRSQEDYGLVFGWTGVQMSLLNVCIYVWYNMQTPNRKPASRPTRERESAYCTAGMIVRSAYS